MVRTFKLRLIPVATLAFAIPGFVYAQQSHRHSDTAAVASHAAQRSTDMDGMDMSASDDWKMAAMAKHMAYSTSRPLTAADSIQSAHVINELRQAIAKYQDVAVAEAAVAERLAGVKFDDIVQQVQDAMWQPEYRRIQTS